MKKTTTRAGALLLALALIFTLGGCASEPEPTPDPHEGMIYVNVGGGFDWLYPVEELAVSDFDPKDFNTDGNLVFYGGDAYNTELGVDVSFYQGVIDWQAVRNSGINFAMIRCGFRGSSAGDLFEDEQYRANIEGALAAGIKVGVYFFSQSIGALEAAEEAQYVLDLIEGYDITMPVAFDWEPLDSSRSDGVDIDDLTASAVVFCELIKDAGYTPCVYFYRKLAYYDYDLSRLAGYKLWVGSPGDAPDFYYAHDIWQFSFTGKIAGIDSDVDLNLSFTAVPPPPPPSPSPTAEPQK